MATWITHLRIAEKLHASLPDLPAETFALGNLAPDSGVPDEKWEHFDPPPEVTHFTTPAGGRWAFADRAFWLAYLAGPRPAQQTLAERAFRLGYFAHLLTDNLWRDEVGRPTRTRFEQQFAADPDFIWEVKKDWYGLDHRYLRENPGFETWRQFLATDPHAPYLDFLPPAAIRQQMETIKGYYTVEDERVREMLARPWIYLTQSEVTLFVERTAIRIEAILSTLTTDGQPAGCQDSYLEVM